KHHLMQLNRVGGDMEIFDALADQADVARQRGADELDAVVHRRIDRERLEVEFGVAAIGQDLLYQRLSTVARLHDLLQAVVNVVLLGQILEQEEAIAEDAAKNIVEVVSDAASKRADRLHLLRGVELLA